MRTKVLTKDCPSCNLLKINDMNQFICRWGKENKILNPRKGKMARNCKLKRG